MKEKTLSEKGEKHLRIDDATHHLSYDHKYVKEHTERAKKRLKEIIKEKEIILLREIDEIWEEEIGEFK